MEILRLLATPLSSTASRYIAKRHSAIPSTNQLDDTDWQWVEVEETVGIFMPQLQRRRQLLQLDQVRHMLHYDNYRRFVRVQDIALVTAVEEVDDDGRFQWWMSIQDASVAQVWIVHFASLQQLQSWVDRLRVVTRATGTRVLIGDIVVSSSACQQTIAMSCSPITKETILDMGPEEPTEEDRF